MVSAALDTVMVVDLSTQSATIERRPDLFEEFLGGIGVAIKLLKEHAPRGVDPLSPEAPIVFAIGPLNSFFPSASKTVAAFKSPLTGNLGESYAGGRLCMAMRHAGLGAVVIKGAANSPIYLAIHDKKVFFKRAGALWGVYSALSVVRILTEVEPGKGKRSIMAIGRAGENLVKFANVIVDTHRHFGRLGLGAVFGAKKLKAIVISGTATFTVPKHGEYMKVYRDIYKEIVTSGKARKYHELGTAENVMVLNTLGALPTRNFSSGKFERAEAISGENLAENFLSRKVSCVGCPVGCVHVATLKIPFAVGYEFGSLDVSYDYEPIYALGSLLGVGNPNKLLQLIERANTFGVDVISTGVALAWATEALERGAVPVEQTRITLKWGDGDAYLQAIELLAKRSTEFYSDLAEGVAHASEKWGLAEYAAALCRNEVAGYHTGYFSYLGQAFGGRHSHLDNGGYSVDQRLLREAVSREEALDLLLREEAWRCVTNSLVTCLFVRGIYTPETVAKALLALGIEKSVDDLMALGKRVMAERFSYKLREGFSPQFDLPKVFLRAPTPHGLLDRGEYERLARAYWGKLTSELRLSI